MGLRQGALRARAVIIGCVRGFARRVVPAAVAVVALGAPLMMGQALWAAMPADAALIDGRAYELISPAHKHGAVFSPIYTEGAVIQAAAGGAQITYPSYTATESTPAGEPAPEWAQIFSRRQAPGSWSTQDIATPKEETFGLNPGNLSEYRSFSTDLASGFVEPLDPMLLSPYATERTPYVRETAACDSGSTECFVPLVTAAAGRADVAEGVHFGGAHDGHGELETLPVQFAGANADLRSVVVSAKVPLIGGAGEGELYEWSSGSLAAVSALPGAMEADAACPKLGYNGGVASGDVRNAVSANGTLVTWEAARCSGTGKNEPRLYVRDMVTRESAQLDRVQPGAIGEEGKSEPEYRDASADGATVFFTDCIALTSDSTLSSTCSVFKGDGRDLYVCEITRGTSGLECQLSDLTVPVVSGEHANVLGVLGASSDGSKAYVVARGVLTERPSRHGERAVSGRENLYVIEREAPGKWNTSFVATLSSNDKPDWEGAVESAGTHGGMTSRVSPNGRFVAFMSERSLTGYENRDVESGEPDEEVYLYDAQTGALACVSCASGGTAPTGQLMAGASGKMTLPLVERVGAWGRRWVAALVPPWTPDNLGAAVYQSRYLSDEGRVFFDSDSALVTQDTNRTWDVYEFEPVGVGSCTTATDTPTTRFDEAAGGCVGLISSGASASESAFLDASDSGEDVFFLTSAKLVSQDTDGAIDVYDAHQCSASSPCASPAPSATVPCSKASSCRATQEQPALLGAPLSASFAGAGNLAAPPKPKPRKTTARTRRQKLKRALRACDARYRRNRRMRRRCDQGARRRFGGAHAAVRGAAHKTRRASASGRGRR